MEELTLTTVYSLLPECCTMSDDSIEVDAYDVEKIDLIRIEEDGDTAYNVYFNLSDEDGFRFTLFIDPGDLRNLALAIIEETNSRSA